MGYVLITVLVTILVFLILREVMAWYWKINERIDILTKISNSLAKIETTLELLITDTNPKNEKNISNTNKTTETQDVERFFNEPRFKSSKVIGEDK